MAYGPLGLTPSQLLELQPREFYAMCEGVKLKRDLDNQYMAYFVAWLLVPYQWKSKSPTPEEILKPLRAQSEEEVESLQDQKQRYLDMIEQGVVDG